MIATLARIRHLELEYHEVHARFGYRREHLFAHLGAGGLRMVSWSEDSERTGLASFVRGVG
jgi:hypothetical protein